MPVINRETGLPITPQEQEAVDRRAREILSSPYSAPEKVAWAFECASPDVGEMWFWESVQEQAIERRRAARLAEEAR